MTPDLEATQERCVRAEKAAERERKNHRTDQWAILYSEDVPGLLARIEELEAEVEAAFNAGVEEGERDEI